jgi:hypothetical protein
MFRGDPISLIMSLNKVLTRPSASADRGAPQFDFSLENFKVVFFEKHQILHEKRLRTSKRLRILDSHDEPRNWVQSVH